MGMVAWGIGSDLEGLFDSLIPDGAKDKSLWAKRHTMNLVEAFFIGGRPFGSSFQYNTNP